MGLMEWIARVRAERDAGRADSTQRAKWADAFMAAQQAGSPYHVVASKRGDVAVILQAVKPELRGALRAVGFAPMRPGENCDSFVYRSPLPAAPTVPNGAGRFSGRG